MYILDEVYMGKNLNCVAMVEEILSKKPSDDYKLAIVFRSDVCFCDVSTLPIYDEQASMLIGKPLAREGFYINGDGLVYAKANKPCIFDDVKFDKDCPLGFCLMADLIYDMPSKANKYTFKECELSEYDIVEIEAIYWVKTPKYRELTLAEAFIVYYKFAKMGAYSGTIVDLFTDEPNCVTNSRFLVSKEVYNTLKVLVNSVRTRVNYLSAGIPALTEYLGGLSELSSVRDIYALYELAWKYSWGIWLDYDGIVGEPWYLDECKKAYGKRFDVYVMK